MSNLTDQVNSSERVAKIPIEAEEACSLDAMSSVVLATPAGFVAGAQAAGAGLAAMGIGVGVGEAID
jgi:hypothetical protein